MRLVYASSGRAVSTGDVLDTDEGRAQVHGFMRPTDPLDQGSVTLLTARGLMEVPAARVAAKWIGREDHFDARPVGLEGSVGAILRLAAVADLIEVDGEHFVRGADIVCDPSMTGGEDEPVLFLSYREGGEDISLKFTVEGLRAGSWEGERLRCRDTSGTEVVLKFVRFVSLKH